MGGKFKLKKIPVNVVDAGGVIKTRSTGALVDIDRTTRPSKARMTLAIITIDEIDAGAAVGRTGRRVTFVYVNVAQLARKAGRTLALVAVYLINARRIIATRHRQALVDVYLTVGPRVAGHTVARQIVAQIDLTLELVHRHLQLVRVGGQLAHTQPVRDQVRAYLIREHGLFARLLLTKRAILTQQTQITIDVDRQRTQTLVQERVD